MSITTPFKATHAYRMMHSRVGNRGNTTASKITFALQQRTLKDTVTYQYNSAGAAEHIVICRLVTERNAVHEAAACTRK